ncbi:MAG: hypothetical protein KKG32_08580 [Alphaproteobacteria bacterium]|nr:hypothetical protein [Alphaproteobacteria bacterium]
MAFTRESFGESLFESVGRSSRDLPATIEALACALVTHGRLDSLVMQFDDIGLLTVERQSRGLASHWDPRFGRLVETGTAGSGRQCPAARGGPRRGLRRHALPASR